MTTKVQALIIITLGATLMIASAQTTQPTAAATAPPPPALSPTEQRIKDIKNPASWINWGADMRIRNEYFNNAQTLTSDPSINSRADLHSQDYFRFRGRIWTDITPVTNVTLRARLAAEPREWMESASSGTFFRQTGMEWRYGIVDNLSILWNKPVDLPVSLRVGRQDIAPQQDMLGAPPWGPKAGLGDAWLVGDGTPGDGSWTFFFDAARLTLNLEEQKTTIDAIGILQYAEPDEWLPTIGSSTTAGSPNRYALTEQNEKGAVLWVNNKSIKPANLDGYFIYKHDTRQNNLPPGATDASNGAGTYAAGDNADIYTLGGRVSGLLKEHWQYRVEGAYQFGQKQDPLLNKGGDNSFLDASAQTTGFRDISAFGVNSRLSYLFNDTLKNEVFLSYEFLSGDKAGTGNDEMFDILWGRYPRWSEMYNVYSLIPETRAGQMANSWRLGPGWTIWPTKSMAFGVQYNALFAQQDVPTRASVPDAFTTTGNFRGHYFQTILRYQFSRHLQAHLWGEFVLPGNFYVSDQAMTFLRAEVWLTF